MGAGLATEAAAAARDDAFGRLRLPELISIIHPENERSKRVAIKLGMRLRRQIHNPVFGIEVDVWEVAAVDCTARVMEVWGQISGLITGNPSPSAVLLSARYGRASDLSHRRLRVSNSFLQASAARRTGEDHAVKTWASITVLERLSL